MNEAGRAKQEPATTGETGRFEAQINGVSPDVLVSATGGTDAETDDEYRSWALAIIQKRRQTERPSARKDKKEQKKPAALKSGGP